MNADLVVSGLTVQYTTGDYVVKPVEDFSFTVADGSLALLLGPSGCGKTTLLSCLAGILRPAAGSIRQGSREVTDLRGPELTDYRRNGVGLVFQAFNLIPSLSAFDNVMLPMRNARMPTARARARTSGLLDDMGMGDRADHLPAELSGGQQQRVAIARALALEPPLLLADEPTAHLDYVQVETTLRIFRRLTTPGRVLVIVTHDERLLPLADQVIELVPHRPASPTGPVDLSLAAGEVVFEQGDPGDLIYVIEEGVIEIVRTLPDGSTEVIAALGAEECFGEMAPLFGLRRSAGARAATDARLTGYSVTEFREAMGIERLDGLVRGRGAGRPATE